MKCDRRWWNDGRLERECAEQRAHEETIRKRWMHTHPSGCWCMLCVPQPEFARKIFRDELRVTEGGTVTETQEVDVLWPKTSFVMNVRLPVKS